MRSVLNRFRCHAVQIVTYVLLLYVAQHLSVVVVYKRTRRSINYMHCGAFEIFIGRPICATDGRTYIESRRLW